MKVNGYELIVVCANYDENVRRYGDIYDSVENCLNEHPYDEILYGYYLKSSNGEETPDWFNTLEEAIEWANDTYGCDGLNDNCMENVHFDNVYWFSNGMGFCKCCHDKLFKQIGDRYDELYDRCEANDEKALEEVCQMTI